MKRKSQTRLTLLVGCLWLAVFLVTTMFSEATAAQAKETTAWLLSFTGLNADAQRQSLPLSKTFGPTGTLASIMINTGPVSVTQVSPLMVLSGPLPDIPTDYMIVEGDIQIPKSAFATRYLLGKTAYSVTGPNGTFESNRWPNGMVPYEFDSSVTTISRTLVQQAMTDWQAIANVQFTQCTNNNCSGDFVHIQASNGNNSAVGRQGGRQIVNLVSWSSRYTIAHELGHALGFEHEQSRSDRNSFIQVNYNNVCKATDATCNGGFCFDGNGNRIDCDFNFNIAAAALTYGVYDFDSVMHYGRTAFSRNVSDTITVLAPFTAQWQNAIGQRTHLSQADKNAMGCNYPLAIWRWVSTTPQATQAGDCFMPYGGFTTAFAATPSGGMLWIEPGSYSAIGIYNKAITLKAPNGLIILGQ